VLDVLASLTREAGKTMVVVTHSPEVREMADRVFRLHDGVLLEEARVGPGR
jgi:putative ABC transport system ATP-binding protein